MNIPIGRCRLSGSPHEPFPPSSSVRADAGRLAAGARRGAGRSGRAWLRVSSSRKTAREGLGRSFAGSAAAPGDCVGRRQQSGRDERAARAAASRPMSPRSTSRTKFHGSGEDFLGRPLTGGNGGDGGLTQAGAGALPHRIRSNDAVVARRIADGAVRLPDRIQRRLGRPLRGAEVEARIADLTFAARGMPQRRVLARRQRHRAAHQRRADPGDRLRHDPRRSRPTARCCRRKPTASAASRATTGVTASASACCGKRRRTTASASTSIRRSITRSKATASSWCRRTCCRCSAAPSSTRDGKADFDTPVFATASWWHTRRRALSFGADSATRTGRASTSCVVQYANPMQPNSASIFDWDDTWFASVGGDYRLDPNWTLRAGVAYDQTPTKDSTRDSARSGRHPHLALVRSRLQVQRRI